MLKHLEKGSEAQDNPLLRRQHGIAEGALALVMIPEIQSLICYEPVGCTQAINWSICPASLTCKMMVLNDLFCPFCLDSMRSCCLNDFGINREVSYTLYIWKPHLPSLYIYSQNSQKTSLHTLSPKPPSLTIFCPFQLQNKIEVINYIQYYARLW